MQIKIVRSGKRTTTQEDKTMIDGVKTKDLRVIPDERGLLMEMLRCDDEIFQQFGQVYLSVVYPSNRWTRSGG